MEHWWRCGHQNSNPVGRGAIWCNHSENSLVSLVKLNIHCGRLYYCHRMYWHISLQCPSLHFTSHLLSSDLVVWLTLAYKIWMEIIHISLLSKTFYLTVVTGVIWHNSSNVTIWGFSFRVVLDWRRRATDP